MMKKSNRSPTETWTSIYDMSLHERCLMNICGGVSLCTSLFVLYIWMLIAEGPSWWTKEIFAPWKCWFHTLCKVPGLHGLHPTGPVASPILTFAPAVALEAAAERGLRLTYCSVNGHQVGAPVRIPLGIWKVAIKSNWITMDDFFDCFWIQLPLRYGVNECLCCLRIHPSIFSRTRSNV